VRQVEVRALLADLTNKWTTLLTDTQREAWELYAQNVPLINVLGEARNVSGINMYVRSNSLLIDAGGTRLDDAPTEFTVGPTITPTMTIDSAADTFDVTDLGTYNLADGDVYLLFSSGRPVQQGVNFYKAPFRKAVGIFAQDTTNEPPYAGNALPYPVAAGQALFLRCACVTTDGRVGVPTIQRFLVT
tara:strand:- start:242 stop:805 length:564 start_codon:yes stop_codon:yes gene_type:complete